MGSIITYLPKEPRSLNLMRPLILAKRVSSLPRPTLRPGFTRVPRWRTMMVPPGTTCPPKALNPSRWELESRPFLELPNPFLCAIKSVLGRWSLRYGSEQAKIGRWLNPGSLRSLTSSRECSLLFCRLPGRGLFGRLLLDGFGGDGKSV